MRRRLRGTSSAASIYSLLVWAAAIGVGSSSNSSSSGDANKNNNAAVQQEVIRNNPFYSGCLQQKVPGWNKQRVCSSRKELNPPTVDAVDLGLCREPEFDYMEIRIATGNWDSATALGWLTQIILSEILGVPSSIESGAYGSSRDFYDPQGAIDYDTGMSPNPLIVASKLRDSDCLTLKPPTSDDDYEQCAHFYPEFWGEPTIAIQDQQVEPPQGTGFLGLETWFITKFTAEEYPEFVSYHGLQKEENREKLATLFKRPTTWLDYCELVSTDNCTTPDDVAQRAPLEDEEATRMFLHDLYTGHFRSTPQNNCTLFPSNCTGHIANYPCGWSSNMESNLYYLNIPLDANNAPNGGPNGYTEQQLKDMWYAANATRSHLMMQWWMPEPLYQHFLGSEAELQQVILKPYTRECAKAREEWKDECSDDLATRVGIPEEACGNPMEPIRKLINVGLNDALNSPDIPDEARSAAYDVLRLFQINDIQLGELFNLWESEATPRDGVCTWAANNLDFLKMTIPTSYPRVTEENSSSVLGHIATALGCLAAVLVLLTAWSVYKKRGKDSIQFAQMDFLSLSLAGIFLVSLGSILLSLSESDLTCLASIWFINLGYGLELVPLIIKVAAINRMMEAAREMRRVTIRREVLYKAVAFISFCLVVYLAIWSAVDPPQLVPEYSLTESTTDLEERIVAKTFYCNGGDSDIFQFVAVGWNAVLLLCASVLAFQSRNVIQKFNESRSLAFLIYSHFIFVMARISVFLLSGHVSGTTLEYALSLIFAFDQMATCAIYFLPKLTAQECFDTDQSEFMSRQLSRRMFALPPSQLASDNAQSSEMLGRIAEAQPDAASPIADDKMVNTSAISESSSGLKGIEESMENSGSINGESKEQSLQVLPLQSLPMESSSIVDA